MLWQENTIRMVRPTGTSPLDVIGAEARRKVSAGYCAANVFDEPAHSAKCGIHAPVAHLTRVTYRPAAKRTSFSSVRTLMGQVRQLAESLKFRLDAHPPKGCLQRRQDLFARHMTGIPAIAGGKAHARI